LDFTKTGHAAWEPGIDEAENGEMIGLSSIRYCRFSRKVRVGENHLLPVWIRWAPDVDGQPKTVIAEGYCGGQWAWHTKRNLNCRYTTGELHTFEGVPRGYEGVLASAYCSLAALAECRRRI